MRNICLLMLSISISGNALAESFRCARKVVKPGDSGNMLIKKCGKPVRKFSSKETIYEGGRHSNLAVSNWVYERNGKKDIIVSVRSGTVIKIKAE
jgi:hypothetical protein